jgi:hypothetical protein
MGEAGDLPKSLPLICNPNFSFMGEAGDQENN